MNKFWVLLLLIALTQGCSTYRPTNAENLCDIFWGETDWYEGARTSKKRWGTPIPLMMSIIYQESSFRPKVRPERPKFLFIPLPRRSSAYGYAQATDEAWKDYKKDTGRRFVKRSNFGDALDFVGWYNDRSNKRLRLRKNDTYNLYLAYYNGHSGYAKGAWKKSATIKGYAKKASRQAAIYAKQLRRCT